MTETVDDGSIDDLLGPSGGRFFGEGFRRVEHAVSQVRLGLLETGRFGLSGEASLSYPSSWSTKNSGSELRPHLSTVDAFVLAVQMIDVLLVKHLGLSPNERAAAWLAAVEFRSGTTPVEALEDVRMYASIVSTTRARNPLDGPYQSVVDAAVGTIKMKLVVCHDVALHSARAETFSDVDAVLGPREERFYGDGYKKHVHRIGRVRFDDPCTSAVARVQILRDGTRQYPNDLGGAYRPSVSILDCIIAQAQISQALMYKLDDIDRSETNTLWMRKVTIRARTPLRSLDAAFDSRTVVESSRLLSLDGGVYRSTEFSGCFQGLTSRYSLAHELPASVLDRMCGIQLATPSDAPVGALG